MPLVALAAVLLMGYFGFAFVAALAVPRPATLFLAADEPSRPAFVE